MTIDVIPIKRMPRSLSELSYNFDINKEKEIIEPGMLIEIPLRNKVILGVVKKVDKNSYKKRLKNAGALIYDKPLVSKSLLSLIDYLNENFCQSKATLINSILPYFPKKQKDLPKFKSEKKCKGFSEKYAYFNQRVKMLDFIFEKKKESGQILILTSQAKISDEIYEFLQKKDDDLILYDSGFTAKEKRDLWLKTKNEENLKIISSKIGVFLPFFNLKQIFIIDAEDDNFKQADINPRFDSRMVANFLARYFKAEIYYLGTSFNANYYKNSNLKERKRLKNFKKLKTELVSLNMEKFKGNYSFLSDKLIELIKNSLDEKKKILILHNKKAWANYIFCNDCGYIFKCPDCNISLSYQQESGKLFCRHCNFQQDMPPFCPQCSGTDIKLKGQGIEKIASEIEKEFKQKKIEKIYKESGVDVNKIAKANIVLATEYILNKVDLKLFDLIAFTNFDQLLNRPDYRTQERALNFYLKIRASTNAKIIIQCSDIENSVLQAIQNENLNNFFEKSLEERKIFNYPPFSQLVKVVAYGSDEHKLNKELEGQKNYLKTNFKDIVVSQPLVGIGKRKKSKIMMYLIIRLSKKNKLSEVCKSIKDKYIIEVDPLNIG